MKVDDRPGFKTSLMVMLAVACLLPPVGLPAQEQATPAESSATPGQAPVEDKLVDKHVTVVANDTLQSIALREYGTIGLWRHIAEYNKLDIFQPLYVGQVIKLPLYQSVPREFAQITYLHGNNQYRGKTDSAPRTLTRKDQLFLQDMIETGTDGFVSITFRTGTVINLQPNTRVKLIRLECLEADETCFINVNTLNGSISTDVKRTRGQQNDFTVTTPNASAAVRGTVFDLSADATQVLVGVTDGEIAVSGQGSAVSLPTGFGVQSLAETGPGEPVALLHPPTFTSVPPRLAPGDLVACWQVTDAASYEWTVSTDENASNIVTRTKADARLFTIEDIPAGDYFLGVRAIDAIGLKGFTATEKITVAQIDNATSGVEIEAQRNGRDLLVSVVQPVDDIGGYEIQLSTTDRFDDAVSIDVGTPGQLIFASPQEPIFLRARVLLNPALVSEFGPVLTVN